MAVIWSRPKTRGCLTVFWFYSFLNLTNDECFPLFCMSHQAGFGMSENQIGEILSLCGLLFILGQYVIHRFIYDRFGLVGSIRMGALSNAPLMFVVPISILLNRGANDGEVRAGTVVFLACLLALYRLFSLVFFANMSVATNRTVLITERAKMNGLSALGTSIAQGIGPLFAGQLVAFSVALFGKAASAFIYGVVGVLGCCAVVLAFHFFPTDNLRDTQVETDVRGAGDARTTEMVKLTS